MGAGFPVRRLPVNPTRSYFSWGWQLAWMLSGQVTEYIRTWPWRPSGVPASHPTLLNAGLHGEDRCPKQLEVGSEMPLQPYWCQRYTQPPLADLSTRWESGGKATAQVPHSLALAITMETTPSHTPWGKEMVMRQLLYTKCKRRQRQSHRAGRWVMQEALQRMWDDASQERKDHHRCALISGLGCLSTARFW